mmetsp:Transcript_26575/g.33134  ORF Transcript_26575/g.33134 Transcript_26575/m.33134 type:complete len:230 (-) Transcript_26575:190-879(-)
MWLGLVLDEGAIVAIIAHVLVLLLEVELVGDDLQSFGEVEDPIRILLHLFIFVDDRQDDLALFNLCDGLRESHAQLLSRKQISVRGEALHLGQEEVDVGVLAGTRVNERLQVGCCLRRILQFLNKSKQRLHVDFQVTAVVFCEFFGVGFNVVLDLLLLVSRALAIRLQVIRHVLHGGEGLLQQLVVDEGEQGSVGAGDGTQTLWNEVGVVKANFENHVLECLTRLVCRV